MRKFLGTALVLFFAWGGAAAAPTPTPTGTKAAPVAKKAPVKAAADASGDVAEPEPTPDPLVVKARGEAQRLRDAWDHAKLESTVYDKRYRRAYDRWVQSGKEAKAAAVKKRDQAMLDLKISLEKRRLAWYEWELAKAKQVQLEASAKAKALRDDVTRVKKRIEAMGGSLKPTPGPVKNP